MWSKYHCSLERKVNLSGGVVGFLWQPCRLYQQRPQPKRRRRRRRHRQWQQMLFDIYALINTINNKPKAGGERKEGDED